MNIIDSKFILVKTDYIEKMEKEIKNNKKLMFLGFTIFSYIIIKLSKEMEGYKKNKEE